jgi:Right handed beta helix region
MAAIDNTDELQHLIDAATGPVTISQGAWQIDATRGLLLRSGTHLIVNGDLSAIPTDQDWSHILLMEGVENVTIELNGQILGDRNTHLSTTGTGHGMGVMVSNSKHIHLHGRGVIRDCWGDGIYVIGSQYVTIADVISENNRRNAMSIISVDCLAAFNSAFNYSGGTDPQCGIDLEPDNPTEFIRNVEISHCQFVNNSGAGILFGFGGAPQENFTNIHIHDNVYKGNKPIGGLDGVVSKLLYATCRWIPGYDWWGVQTEYCS